jgi:hypothetical protein
MPAIHVSLREKGGRSDLIACGWAAVVDKLRSWYGVDWGRGFMRVLLDPKHGEQFGMGQKSGRRIPMRKSFAVCAIALWCRFPVPSVIGAEQLPTAREVCKKYELAVEKDLSDGDYRHAIRTVCEYDRAVVALYPARKFELNLLQAAANHLSVHSAFEGWKEQSPKDLDVSGSLSAMGAEALLVLKGQTDADKLILLSFDLGRLLQRAGLEDQILVEGNITQEQLQRAAKVMAAGFGTVEHQEFEKFNGRTGVVMHITAPLGETGPTLVALGADGKIYVFFLVSSAQSAEDNARKLDQTVRTADFNYKPAVAAVVTSAKAKVRDKHDVGQALTCVRELAENGEYGDASKQLSQLLLLVAEKMPGPVIKNDVGTFPLYDISIKNPDPQRWKMSVSNKGGMSMLTLEDQLSVNPSAITLGVINMDLTFSPQFTENFFQPGDESGRKDFLKGAGRGAVTSICKEVQSERFRTFKGMFSYEGVGVATGIPDTSIKSICGANPGYLFLVIQMFDSRDKTKSDEMDAILDKNLEIKPPASSAK